MVYFAYICYSKVLCLLPCHFHRANKRFLCFSFVICSVFVAKEEKPENCNKLQQFHCIYLKIIVLQILNRLVTNQLFLKNVTVCLPVR